MRYLPTKYSVADVKSDALMSASDVTQLGDQIPAKGTTFDGDLSQAEIIQLVNVFRGLAFVYLCLVVK